MRKARWIAVLVVCVCIMSIPAFAQLPSSGWPKYQRDAYNSGRSPATLIAKPVVSWTYSLGFMPSVTGLAIDGSGYCYVMSTGPDDVVKIAPNGTAATGWAWTVPDIVGSTVTTNRNGPTLFDNGTNQRILVGPGRSATTNAKTYAGVMGSGSLDWTTPFAYTDYYSATANTYTNDAVGEDGTIYTHTQGGTYATVDEWGPLFALNSDGTYKWMYNSFIVAGTTYFNGIGGCNGTFAVKRIPASGGVPAHNRIFISGGERYAYWQTRTSIHKYQVYAIDDMGTYGDLVWGAFCENAYGPASISNDGSTLYVGGSDNWGSYATPASGYPTPTPNPANCASTLYAYDTNTGGKDPIDAYKGTGEAKWAIHTGSQHIHPPAIGADGTLYLSSTGAVLATAINGSTFDESYKYFRTNVGRVIAVTDNGNSASIKWTLELPDDCWQDTSNIVVANTDPQVLYVGTGKGRLTTGGRIYAIADMGDHAEILWSYQGISDSANAWPRYLALNDNGDLFAEFGKYIKKFSAGTGFDIDNPNGISGYVKDANGNPIANAWVAASTSSDPLVYSVGRIRTRTNADGYYHLGLVNAGTYYIAATAPNYSATDDQTVTLTTTSDVVKQNFTLQPAGFDWALAADVTCPNYLAGYPPTRAVDGSTSSLFAIAKTYMPSAFTIDLGAARTIDELAIYWEQGWGTSFTIDYSDDSSTWNNVKTFTNNDGGFVQSVYLQNNPANKNTTYPIQKCGYGVVRFAPQTARYWRMRTTAVGGTGSNLVFWELELRESTLERQPFTITGAKNTPEGGGTVISSAVVTATPGGGVPTDTIFIETADRTAGIKVHMTGLSTTVQFGDSVSVAGKVCTDSYGLRYVEATSITRLTATTCPDGPAIEELSMNNKAAADSVSQNLFIKTWGKVSNSTTGSFKISDGSAKPIKILCSSTAAMPADDDYVRVRGVVGKDADGTVLYMRDERADWAYGSDDMHSLPFTGTYDYPIQYLVLGPFTTDPAPTNAYDLLDVDFIGEASVGTTIKPAEGLETAGKTWKVGTSASGILDINSVLGGTNASSAAYVHLYVWSDTEAPAVAMVTGSDDWLSVFANGALQYSIDETTNSGMYATGRSCTIGQDGPYDITLHQGLNSILFKVVNNISTFKLASQFVDSESYGGIGYGGYNPYITTGLGYSLNPATP
ncbi:MAG: carboxypeptidase regulatory-like domain-containing protein [Armatimonadota bacterium]